jgi:hypothetical protein
VEALIRWLIIHIAPLFHFFLDMSRQQFLFFSIPPFSAVVFLTCTTVETFSVVIIGNPMSRS